MSIMNRFQLLAMHALSQTAFIGIRACFGCLGAAVSLPQNTGLSKRNVMIRLLDWDEKSTPWLTENIAQLLNTDSIKFRRFFRLCNLSYPVVVCLCGRSPQKSTPKTFMQIWTPSPISCTKDFRQEIFELFLMWVRMNSITITNRKCQFKPLAPSPPSTRIIFVYIIFESFDMLRYRIIR